MANFYPTRRQKFTGRDRFPVATERKREVIRAHLSGGHPRTARSDLAGQETVYRPASDFNPDVGGRGFGSGYVPASVPFDFYDVTDQALPKWVPDFVPPNFPPPPGGPGWFPPPPPANDPFPIVPSSLPRFLPPLLRTLPGWLPALWALYEIYKALQNPDAMAGGTPGSIGPAEQLACGGGGVRIQNLAGTGAEQCVNLGDANFVGAPDWGPSFPGIAPPPQDNVSPWDYYSSRWGTYVRPTFGGSVWNSVAFTYHEPAFPPVVIPGARWFLPNSAPEDDPLKAPYPFGAPEIASAMPLLNPILQVQPNPIPWQTIAPFNRLAQTGDNPWIQREVGPAPSSLPSPEHWPDVAPRQSIVPRSMFGPAAAPDPWTPPQVGRIILPEPFPVPGPVVSGQPLPYGPPVINAPPSWGPPPRGTRERKLRAPRSLIHGLALSTYAGGTIRELWKALPKKCRSKSRSGKRRYSSMISDVYNCYSQLDWNKFERGFAQMLVRYQVEGKVIRTINRATPYGSTIPLGTQVMHNTGGLPLDYNPSAGGAWSGRQSPFSIIDRLQPF